VVWNDLLPLKPRFVNSFQLFTTKPLMNAVQPLYFHVVSSNIFSSSYSVYLYVPKWHCHQASKMKGSCFLHFLFLPIDGIDYTDSPGVTLTRYVISQLHTEVISHKRWTVNLDATIFEPLIKSTSVFHHIGLHVYGAKYASINREDHRRPFRESCVYSSRIAFQDIRGKSKPSSILA